MKQAQPDTEFDVQHFYQSASEIRLQRQKKANRWFFIIALLLILSSILCSCTKDPLGNSSGCWTCIDNAGATIQVICADTEQEAFDKSGNINGVHTIQNFRNHCSK